MDDATKKMLAIIYEKIEKKANFYLAATYASLAISVGSCASCTYIENSQTMPPAMQRADSLEQAISLSISEEQSLRKQLELYWSSPDAQCLQKFTDSEIGRITQSREDSIAKKDSIMKTAQYISEQQAVTDGKIERTMWFFPLMYLGFGGFVFGSGYCKAISDVKNVKNEMG